MNPVVAAAALALRLFLADVGESNEQVVAAAVQPVLSWQAALNAHDVATSVGVFTEDAVVIQPKVGGLPQVFVGRDEIAWWVRNLVAQGVQVELRESPRLDGDRATWVGSLSVDAYRGLGVEAAETASEATLSGGLISSLTTVLTPAGARQIHSSPGVRFEPAAAPVEAPATGEASGSLSLVVSALASGSVGFGGGLLLGRRASRVPSAARLSRSV